MYAVKYITEAPIAFFRQNIYCKPLIHFSLSLSPLNTLQSWSRQLSALKVNAAVCMLCLKLSYLCVGDLDKQLIFYTLLVLRNAE